ncbi:Carbonic anhydrase 9 [Carabus blaptoides fortunei]
MYSILVILLLQGTLIIAHGFGYGRSEQLQWKNENFGCGGNLQSPIFVNSSTAVPMGMPALEMIGYHTVLSGKLKLQNNGHSVALSMPEANNNYIYQPEIPYIFGAMLDNEYQFEGLHFHWGETNNRGSEHILNDVRYPLEMHLIHRNKKYPTIEMALKHKDGLTVLAVFFQLRETKYKPLDIILHHLSSVKKHNSDVIFNSNCKLESLLPEDTDIFYTYRGSLTTPPCSEVVTWIIFPDPILISFEQMDMFRLLKGTNELQLSNNYRHLQPLGSRKVFVRKPGWKNSKHFTNGNFLKWIWYN